MFLRMVWFAIGLKFVAAVFYLQTIEGAVLNKNVATVTLNNSDFLKIDKMGDNRTTIGDEPVALEGERKNVYYSQTVTSNLVEESRKKKQNQKGFMERILPMMVMPFMVSTSMIPMMLISIKFMLLKSALVGVVGISLMLLNMFRRRTNDGGVFNHNVKANDEAMEHYGYHGDEEYGAYVNRRRRKRNTRYKI